MGSFYSGTSLGNATYHDEVDVMNPAVAGEPPEFIWFGVSPLIGQRSRQLTLLLGDFRSLRIGIPNYRTDCPSGTALRPAH